MDNELEHLEHELRQLKPRAPKASTVLVVAAALVEDGPRKRVVRSRWLVLPIAAALALIFLWQREPDAAPSKASREPAAAFKPVGAINVLLSSQDEGYVTLSDGTTARRVRQTYLDTFTWKNPQTHASLSWTVPREDVRVLPVNYQ